MHARKKQFRGGGRCSGLAAELRNPHRHALGFVEVVRERELCLLQSNDIIATC